MDYLSQVRAILDAVEQTQGPAMEQAARAIADQVLARKVLNVFATGHSHMLAEELYFRAGGLVPVNVLFEPGLMLHEGPRKSSALEKLPGYAKIILDRAGLTSGALLLIISTSGVNAVPVEMAKEARRNGVSLIALTSVAASQGLPLQPGVKQRLFELADIVLDNCVPMGDAVYPLGEGGLKVGPVSTVIGAAILNNVVCLSAEELRRGGMTPPVLVSNNVPGGREHNEQVLQQFAGKINPF